jgi:hypothetical protein
MPPLVVFALGVIGATVLARWCVKEVRRVNVDLDEMRAKTGPLDRSSMPKLKPDPKTGEYRPG